MNESLMISIQPQHVVNVLNGDKDRELRTWIPKGYVGWVYVYVTKGKPYIIKYRDTNNYRQWNRLYCGKEYALNGKVVFRFWFDDYETYDFDNHGVNLYTDVEEYNVMYDDLERLCLDYREIENYGNGKTLYAWHIKKLEIFDNPKELSEFESRTPYKNNDGRVVAWGHSPIIKAPQKMVYVYVNE